MGRSYLAGRAGDANNAVLAAVGYNFNLLIKWLRLLLIEIWIEICSAVYFGGALKMA